MRISLLLLLLVSGLTNSCRRQNSARAGSQFNQGDARAASELLADDAQVLENGERESRAQHLEQRLTADILFAQSVATTRTATIVRQEGKVHADGHTALVSLASIKRSF